MAKKPIYYKGLREIAERLSVGRGSVPRLQQDFALPIYLSLANDRPGSIWTWTISESQIRTWECWKARIDRAYFGILKTLGEPVSNGGAPAHAKLQYLTTVTRYRQLLVEQQKSGAIDHKRRALSREAAIDLELPFLDAPPSHPATQPPDNERAA